MPPALHLSTVLTRQPSKLVSHIAHVAKEHAGKGHTLLFALSNNFKEPQGLQEVVDELSKFNDENASEHDGIAEKKGKVKGHTIGCLSDSFSSTTFEGLPISRSTNDDLLSCSIGIFDSNLCVPFHSTLPGRALPQVGRWHSFRKKNGLASSSGAAEESWEPDWQNMDAKRNVEKENNGIDWEAIWNRSSTSPDSSVAELLPETLRRIKLSQVQALFTLSAPHPDALTSVLANNLPTIPSLTLIAAPTHFITGRGVTLFMDGRIFGEGAIGIALLDQHQTIDESKAQKPTCSTDFIGMRRLSGQMTVTSREGNMINELDFSNPTKLLLRSLDLAGISPTSHSQSNASSRATTFKDEAQFALGIVGPDGHISRTYKITAGDPSSRGGSISLDASMAPGVGSVVQFLHVPSNSPIEIPASFFPASRLSDTHKQVLAYVTVPEPSNLESVPMSTESPEFSSQILQRTFLAPSTQGFVLSQPPWSALSKTPSTTASGEDAIQSPRSPWICSLPGGIVSLRLN